jgi:hypothetical protein
MKGSTKYLNILVPTLILACVVLFYMDDVISEGFQSPSPLFTAPPSNTTTYCIYLISKPGSSNNIIPVKVTSISSSGLSTLTLTPTTTNNPSKWTAGGISLSKQNAAYTFFIGFSSTMGSKLIDYDVDAYRGGVWRKSTTLITSGQIHYKTNSSRPLQKANATNTISNNQIILPYSSNLTTNKKLLPNGLSGITFSSMQYGNTINNSGDPNNSNSIIRILLNFSS